MHSKKGSVTYQRPKSDKITKWEKLINRKIRPEERRNWNFAFVADEIGWFDGYLAKRNLAPSAQFWIPVDLTEGLDIFEYCLKHRLNRHRDNSEFFEINHTSSFVIHFFRF